MKTIYKTQHRAKPRNTCAPVVSALTRRNIQILLHLGYTLHHGKHARRGQHNGKSGGSGEM